MPRCEIKGNRGAPQFLHFISGGLPGMFHLSNFKCSMFGPIVKPASVKVKKGRGGLDFGH